MRTSDKSSRPLGVNCLCFSLYMATWRLPSGWKGYRAVPSFFYQLYETILSENFGTPADVYGGSERYCLRLRGGWNLL